MGQAEGRCWWAAASLALDAGKEREGHDDTNFCARRVGDGDAWRASG
jgi:hypothetical protein